MERANERKGFSDSAARSLVLTGTFDTTHKLPALAPEANASHPNHLRAAPPYLELDPRMSASSHSAQPDWLAQWLQLSRQLRRHLAQRYDQGGLTESRAAVLEALSSAAPHCTQAELAAQLGLSESNLCALIERMRQDGLLDRERSLIDRRKTLLKVTPVGQDRCAAIQRIHAALSEELAEQVPDHVRDAMREWVDLMQSILHQRDGRADAAGRAA